MAVNDSLADIPEANPQLASAMSNAIPIDTRRHGRADRRLERHRLAGVRRSQIRVGHGGTR
jgi:hypothetical protein